MLFVCYVGYEYAMCNFRPNKFCSVNSVLTIQLCISIFSIIKNREET